MRIVLLFIFFVFASFHGKAQNTTDLDPVSVTNSRTSQKASTTGRQVTVISGSDFSKFPVLSIDELLKYASGVEVQQRGIGGSQGDISIRGGTFQQVLVLLDGMKLNDPITGHFSGYMPIDPSQIDRIEIIKGTSSAIYGAEAVGGVIHIISKTFSRFMDQKSGKGNMTLSGGEYGLFGARASVHTTGKLNFSLAGSTTNAHGQILRSGRNAYFNNHAFSANAAFRVGETGILSLHSSYDDRDFAAENYYTTFKSDTASERVKTWWNHLKYKNQKNKLTEELDIVYKQTTDHYLFNRLSKANDNESKLLSIQYLQSRLINKNFNYTLGTSVEQKTILSNDRGNHTNHHIALFSSGVITKNKLTINPGLRMDYDERYKLQVLPQLSFAYRNNHFNYRALAGRSIRAADFTERFNNYNKRNLRSGSIGNPELNAEQAWNYEVGIDYIKTGFKVSATAFYRDQKDVIDWVTTPYTKIPRKTNLAPNGVFAFAQNIRRVKTTGIETEIQYQHNFSNDLFLRAGSSLMLLNSETGDSITSFYIVSHAHAIWQQTALLTYKKVTWSVNGIYKKRKGQQATAIFAEIKPSYYLLNTKIQYRCKSFETFISVNNITNVSYSDLLGSVMPRRWTSAGVSLTL